MEQACRVLKISRSVCYGRARRNPCSRKRRNQTLRRRLMEPHQNDLALGLDNLCHLLKPEFGCSHKHVHRQMRLAGIASVRHRACKITTSSRHSHPVAPTLLKRNSFFEQPNQAWGRYYLHSHRRGLALSGHRQGLVYRQKGGLCLFQPYLIPRPPWKRWAGQSAASGGMNEPLPECQGFILLFQVFCVRFSGKGSRIKLCAISIHVSALSSRAQIAFKTANTFSKANLLTFS